MDLILNKFNTYLNSIKFNTKMSMEEYIKLIDEVGSLRNIIEELRKDIQQLQKICGRMDEHISFVNSTYDTMRAPLGAIMNIARRTLRYEDRTTELPQIEKK